MTSLVFLETAEQVQWTCSGTAQFPANEWRALAASPAAVLACQKLELPYLILEDRAKVLSRRSEYEPVFAEFMEWRRRVDDWARERISEFGRTAFAPATAASFCLQRIHAEIWSTTQSLTELFAAESATRIALWPYRGGNIPLSLQPIIPPSIALAADVARTRGISVVDLSLAGDVPRASSPSADGAPASALTRLRVRLSESKLRGAAAAARNGGVQDAIRAVLPRLPGQRRVVACGFGYDLQRLVMELRRSGVAVDQMSERGSLRQDPAMKLRFDTTVDELLAVAGSCGAGPGFGDVQTDLGSSVLRRWWTDVVPRHWAAYIHAERRFRARRYDALVLSNVGDTGMGGAVCAAASACGVPSYLYQHGGSCNSDSRPLHAYVTEPTTFLAYGDGTVCDFEATMPASVSHRSALRAVGSATLDQLRMEGRTSAHEDLRRRLKGDDPRPLVLYVPTHFAGYGRAVSHDLSAHPPTAYFETVQRVLRVWADFPGVRLVYKNFAVANDRTPVVPAFIASAVPDALVTNISLRNLLWAVDAVVVDHVTTAALEVLLTDLPCVFYLPSTTPQAESARVLLRRSARVAETPDEFLNAVREFLARGEFPRVSDRDSAFLRAYGTYRNDGRSARRAADLILDETGAGAKVGTVALRTERPPAARTVDPPPRARAE